MIEIFDDVTRPLRTRCIERHGGVDDVGAEGSGLNMSSCVHENTKSLPMSSYDSNVVGFRQSRSYRGDCML